MAAVAIAVAVSGFMLATERVIAEFPGGEARQSTLIVMSRGAGRVTASRMPDDALRLVRPISHITGAMPVLAHEASAAADGRQLIVYGIDPSRVPSLYPLPLTRGALEIWAASESGAVCGRAIARRLNLREGSDVALDAAGRLRVRVLHIFDAPGTAENGLVFVPRAYLARALDRVGESSFVRVSIDHSRLRNAVARVIDDRLAAHHIPSTTRSETDTLAGVTRDLSRTRSGARVVLSLVAILALLAFAAARQRATIDRGVELALLGALGFRARFALVLVVAETVILSAFGVAVGAILLAAAVDASDASLVGAGVLVTPRLNSLDLVRVVGAAMGLAMLATMPALTVTLRVTGGPLADGLLRHATRPIAVARRGGRG